MAALVDISTISVGGSPPLHTLSGVFLFFGGWGQHLRHMEVPRLGVKLELYMLAYTTAIATWDPSCICYLHYSAGQHQILTH